MGRRVVDDSFYIIFNAHYEPIGFKLPPLSYAKSWHKVLNTAKKNFKKEETVAPESIVMAEGRSIIILKSPREV